MEDHLSLRVEEPLIQTIECRICQEEDIIENLEVPCACNGSLKFAHRKCVQRWCDEKRDIVCEICHQPYKPGYTAPPPQQDDTLIDISGSWTPSAEQQRRIEPDYEEYEDNGASSASLFRSAAIILIALLLLRHSLTIEDDDSYDDDDPSVIFAVFLLRAAGFLLPCYILVWAIGILQRCRQAREAETAADVPFMSQAQQHRTLHPTIAPVPAVAPTPTFTPPVIPAHGTLQ